MEWEIDWGQHIFRNPAKPNQTILINHPVPYFPERLLPILKALSLLNGDRKDSGRIPYTAIDAYLNRNVPVDSQYYFQELLITADTTYVSKVHELTEKQNGRSNNN